MAPKFIICSNGNFRIGFVDQHKDLLQPGDQCIGGGYWEIDPVGMRLILTGHSYDLVNLNGIICNTMAQTCEFQKIIKVYA